MPPKMFADDPSRSAFGGERRQDPHRTRGFAKWYRLEPNGAPSRKSYALPGKGASDLWLARLGKTVLSHVAVDLRMVPGAKATATDTPTRGLSHHAWAPAFWFIGHPQLKCCVSARP